MLISGLDGFLDELERRSGDIGYLKLVRINGRVEEDVARWDWSGDVLAAEDWLHEQAIGAADGVEARLRVRAWGPKGQQAIASRTFTVKPHTLAPLDDIARAELAGAPIADIDATLATPMFRAGAAALVQAVDLQVRVSREHTGESLKIIGELRARLRESESHNGRLMQTLDRERRAQMNDLIEELRDQAVEIARRERELADRDGSPVSVGMEKLAGLGKAMFAAHKGIPQELVDLLAEADPSIVARLGSPKLRRLLKSDKAASMLDELLDALVDDDEVIDVDDATPDDQ